MFLAFLETDSGSKGARAAYRTLAVLLFGVLAGCSVNPDRPLEAMIGPDLPFAIPRPGELGYRVSVIQLITAHYGGDILLFEAHLTISPDRLTLVGFDQLGRRALTVDLTPTGLTTEAAPWLPPALNPANMLADIAIVYWPEETVRRGLRAAATVQSDDHRRSIVTGNHEIIRVDYDSTDRRSWAPSAHYRNEAFGYRLDLRSRIVPE